MKSYRAKYYDGVKPESHSVEVSIKNAILEIIKDREILDHWPLKLVFRDESHLSLFMLGCKGEDARLELLEEGFFDELRGKINISKSHFVNIGRRQITFLITGVIATVFLMFWSVKPLTKILAKNISHETERKLLSSIVDFKKPEFCTLTIEQSFALEKLLSTIYPLDGEDKNSGIEVRVVNSPQENAFALPGANIWLLSGLLRNAKTPEELAGILAHEIEHVKQRHILETLVRGTLVTSFLSFAVGDASGVLIVDPQLILRVMTLSYDRDMEKNADEGAKNRLSKRNISPQGMIDFLERNYKRGQNIPEFLSTHPADKERIESLKAVKVLGSKQILLSSQEWTSLKTVCQ